MSVIHVEVNTVDGGIVSMLRSNATNSDELLEDVEQVILEEPARLNMAEWWMMFHGKPNTGVMTTTEIAPACGTVACVSGWIGILSGRAVEKYSQEWPPASGKTYLRVDGVGAESTMVLFPSGPRLGSEDLLMRAIWYDLHNLFHSDSWSLGRQTREYAEWYVQRIEALRVKWKTELLAFKLKIADEGPRAGQLVPVLENQHHSDGLVDYD